MALNLREMLISGSTHNHSCGWIGKLGLPAPLYYKPDPPFHISLLGNKEGTEEEIHFSHPEFP